MRKSFFTFTFILVSIGGFAQNNLFVNIESGISTFYTANSRLIIDPQNLYFNSLYWDKNINFAITTGVSYQTKSYNFLDNNYYLTTDLSFSYRGYFEKEFVNLLILSNNIYLPTKIKEKKLRFLLGIRNAVILANLVPKENDETLNRSNYIFGGTMLLKYNLTKKTHIGLNAYFDFSRLGGSPRGSKYKTAEAMIRLAYQIR